MKKLFLFVTALSLSTCLWAGENDLLWDYTNKKIPTTTPYEDNGFFYSGYVNDAPSANNGLNGVKLNSSGWAYFEKAAVAGKLRMVIGDRKTQNTYAVTVYRGTKASGANPVKGDKIADTDAVEPGGTVSVNLPADATGIYIERKTGTEGVLCKVQFIEDVPRTFVDFEMVMESMPTGEYEGTVPDGVTYSGTADTDQHGYRGFTITVPVDGTVKFTLGDCAYGDQVIPVKDKTGAIIKSLVYPQAGCYGASTPQNVFTYIYVGGPDTLTFGPCQYMNYFKAEATEVQEAVITYRDQNGNELGKVNLYEGDPIGEVPYTVADLTIPDGQVFRGWVYNNGVKVVATDAVTGNTTVKALVTPVETVTVGSIQTYDFRKKSFYPEDHETISAFNGDFHNTKHGWSFAWNGGIHVDVAGKAVIVIELCTESSSGTVVVYNPDETQLDSKSITYHSTPDGEQFVCQYPGEAGTLKIEWTAGPQYIHKIIVYNVLDFVEKDATTGYYMVPANDAASLIMAIVSANAEGNTKIFVPDGTYDLGETPQTPISASNISLIGQSMEGVIIKNKSVEPGIGSTATLLITADNTYLQDLTLQNDFDYYKNDDGVAVALQDRAGNTVCKNVRLLSHQDTYYSNMSGKYRYFEDCEIHGTVDYICGHGNVYFKNNLLYCEKRKKAGGGEVAVTASNAETTDKGYVFEGCTLMSECPTVSLGRAWNNKPQCVFLNTLVDYSAGNFGFTKSGQIERWTKELMNKGAWPVFGEYNTHLADGTILTPSTNVVTFIDKKDNNVTQDLQTVLDATEIAQYSYANFFGSWDPAAIAAQAECDLDNIDADGIYLVENDGQCEMLKGSNLNVNNLAATATVRKANARGGFGVKAGPGAPAAIEEVLDKAAEKDVHKLIHNGQLIIIRDGKAYNALGQLSNGR